MVNGQYEAVYGSSHLTAFQLDPCTSEIEYNHFESVPPPQELYAISDRINFIHRHAFSTSASIGTIPENWPAQILFEIYTSQEALKFHGKRVLVYIHGLGGTWEGAVSAARQLSKKVQNSYDTVIAYLYPAMRHALEYEQAKVNAREAGQNRLPPILRSIALVAQRVDIVAHSLGCVVAMHALNKSLNPMVGNVFLLGGAMEDNSIFACDARGCSRVRNAVTKAEKIYVMYSCTDEVLPWDHLLRSGQTLGRPGDLSRRPIGDNVVLVNTTPVVRNHSDYLYSPRVIEFLNYAVEMSDRHCSLAYHSYTLSRRGIFPADQEICSVGIDEAIQAVVQKRFGPLAGIVSAPFRLLDQMALAFKPLTLQR